MQAAPLLSSLFRDPPTAVTPETENVETIKIVTVTLALFVLCRWLLGIAGLPIEPHISALILSERAAYVVVVVSILYVISAVVVRVTVGEIRPGLPLFCAAVAMLALPTHGGDIRNALLDAGSDAIFIKMAIETAVLWLIVGLAAMVMRRAGNQGAAQSEMPERATASERATAIVAQAVATVLLLNILGQSPFKGQAIVGVGVAALLAAMIVHQTFRVAGSFCYVSGTMLAGVMAYVSSYFLSKGSISIGDTSGFFAGAARSLPLHFATAGVAGAIYGYWKSLEWESNRVGSDE